MYHIGKRSLSSRLIYCQWQTDLSNDNLLLKGTSYVREAIHLISWMNQFDNNASNGILEAKWNVLYDCKYDISPSKFRKSNVK